MEFSGKNNREILVGSNGSFSLSASINHVTGDARFGISGDSHVPVDFLFSDGKLFNPSGEQIYSYSSGEVVSISGNFSGSQTDDKQYYNYYVNDKLFYTNGESNGFLVEKFFINTTGCTIDAFLDIKSNSAPSYSLVMPSTFRERQNLTGTLTNNTSLGDVKIISGEVTSPTGDYLNFAFTGHNYDNNTNVTAASGGGTVDVVISPSGGLFKQGPYTVSLDLYTNFGKLTTGFNIEALPEKQYSYFLDNLEDTREALKSGDSNQHVFSGGKANVTRTGYVETMYEVLKEGAEETGSFLHQRLEYVNGYTGNMFTGENGGGVYSSGSGNLTGSGIIIGSGFIQSGTTGEYDLSGVDTFVGTPNTFGLSITGVENATGKFYWYATGSGSINYSVTATGYSQLSGNGGLSGTTVLTTGTINGTITETGIGGSGAAYATNSGQEYGKRTFTGFVTGAPTNTGSIDYPTSGLQSGVSLSHTGYFSGDVLATGLFEGITGSGNYSGYLTGYVKTFQNTFDFKTGITNSDVYTAPQVLSGTPVEKYVSSGRNSGVPYEITSKIEFTPKFDNEQMVVRYISSGMNTTGSLNNIKEEILITGMK